MPDKSQLVPKKVQVKGTGKQKPYMAIRYVTVVTPKEIKRRAEEYIKEREKASKYTRYLEKRAHPDYVDIFLPEDLKASVPVKVSKTGKESQYYAKFDIKLIKKIIEFKKPDQVDGAVRLVQLVPEHQGGRTVVQYTDETTTKRKTKIHKRAIDAGEKVAPFMDKINKWLKEKGTTQHRQLAVVLRLMMENEVRVGSGESIKEGPMKVADLKRGMAITHPSWKPGTSPHMVIIKDNKIYLQNIDKANAQKEKIREWQKDRAALTPDEKDILKKLKDDLKKVPGEFATPMPEDWKSVIRIGHYGATELEVRHVKQYDSIMVLEFIGKSNKLWKVPIKDTALKTAFKNLIEGKKGDDQLFPEVDRAEVAKQLRKYKVMPHDFRRYNATKKFIEETRNFPTPTTEKEAKRIENQIFDKVAVMLNDTRGMARTYINPNILAAFRAGRKLGEEAEESKEIQKSLYVILLR